jgi:hypothetical protein
MTTMGFAMQCFRSGMVRSARDFVGLLPLERPAHIVTWLARRDVVYAAFGLLFLCGDDFVRGIWNEVAAKQSENGAESTQ